ncbi:hypothetical protein D6779_05850, partial [Candidatus Parcubacteria bacterium]
EYAEKKIEDVLQKAQIWRQNFEALKANHKNLSDLCALCGAPDLFCRRVQRILANIDNNFLVLPLETLKFLLKRLQTLGFSAKVLYLDKGFASTAIVNYLSAQKQPAIIANPIRGKKGGTRALCRGRSSYKTLYTFSDGTQAMLAMKASLVPDRSGKRRRKWLSFIVILLD